MLSNAAFNALLKTLEEPPRHAIFIFATTEPQKILATILSRCQRFDLRRISLKEIIGRLSEIAKAEDVAIDEAALIAIARGADGGMRDAQSALDQIISFKGKEISEEDVLSVFGLVSRQAMIGLTDAVISNDIPVIIQTIADLDRHGKDMQRLLNELLIHFRDLLVCMHLERGQEFADLADAEELSRQIKSLDTERALRIVDILFSAESRIRFALSPRTVMETTLIKCARAADAVSLDMILEQIEQLKKKDLSSISPSAIALPSPVEQQTRSETSATYHVSSEDDDDDNEEENLDMPDMPSYGVTPNRRRPDPPPAEPSLPPAAVSDDELGVITAQWYNLVEKAARISPSVRTCLVDTRPISVELDTVMIGVDPEFEDKLDQMKYIRNQRAIQHILKQVLRRPVTVHFKLMSDADLDEYLPSDHPVSEAMWAAEKKQSAMTDEDEHGEDTVPADPTNLEDWIKDPSVKKVMELFNGRIVDVRE
jgi:DNA polymerase-3 subunit gamma/tau